MYAIMATSKKKIAVITGTSIIAAGGIGTAVAVSNHANHSTAPSKNKKVAKYPLN